MPTPRSLLPSQRLAQSETVEIPARTETMVELETLERSLLGVLKVLGSLAIVVGLMIVTACVFLLAGNLPLPGDPSKAFVTTLVLLGFASGVLYLVCGVSAFLRKTWAVYTLLVLGYLGAFNAVFEIINGNGLAWINLWLVSLVVQNAHKALSIRRQLKKVDLSEVPAREQQCFTA